MNIYPSDWPSCLPQEPCSALSAITVEEIRRIVLAEFSYWQKASASSECGHTIAMGAVAAAANINAAIMGHLAPWHHPGWNVREITIPKFGDPHPPVVDRSAAENGGSA